MAILVSGNIFSKMNWTYIFQIHLIFCISINGIVSVSVSVSAEMKIIFSVSFQFRQKRKMAISVSFGFGRNEKIPFGRTLRIPEQEGRF